MSAMEYHFLSITQILVRPGGPARKAVFSGLIKKINSLPDSGVSIVSKSGRLFWNSGL